MRNLCVLGWRPHGQNPLYFRGDERYEIYLPYISDEMIEKGRVSGWVTNIDVARIFEMPVVLSAGDYSRHLDMTRFAIYPYEGPVLLTQIFKPIRRPPRGWRQ